MSSDIRALPRGLVRLMRRFNDEFNNEYKKIDSDFCFFLEKANIYDYIIETIKDREFLEEDSYKCGLKYIKRITGLTLEDTESVHQFIVRIKDAKNKYMNEKHIFSMRTYIDKLYMIALNIFSYFGCTILYNDGNIYQSIVKSDSRQYSDIAEFDFMNKKEIILATFRRFVKPYMSSS